MKSNIDVKVITQRDLIDAGCFNFKKAIEVCENALIDYKKGNIIFPNKVSVVFNEKSQSRINCLPAAILSQNVYGMKWVSVFPENPMKYNVQNVSAVIILSELEKGFPKAFMEGTLCSNMRTASMGAIAAKYLARKNSETIGFIGSGEQAKSHFLAMKTILPNIKVCKVSSKSLTSEEEFVRQMKKFYPDVEYVICGTNYKEAANADIIVTAISGQEKILQADWVKEGTFYCHVAGLEDDFGVAQKADKIVCDDWEVVKHREQTISQMYKKGLLKDEDIYANIDEIVMKNKVARENEREFIYFNSVGLSYLDVALSNWMYNKTIEKGLGQTINLQDKSMFDCKMSNEL